MTRITQFPQTPSPIPIEPRENLLDLFRPPRADTPRGLLRDTNRDGLKTPSDLFAIPDHDGNGTIDASDIAALPAGTPLLRPGEERVDTVGIVSKILTENPRGKIFAIGENHAFTPAKMTREMVHQLTQRGKSVGFTIEMKLAPSVDYVANGRLMKVDSPIHAELPRLIDRFNRGALAPEAFLTQLRREFASNPFIAASYDATAQGQILRTIEAAVRGGAKRVYPVDSEALDVPDANRDRVMTNRVAALARQAGKDQVIVGVFGYGHIYERPFGNETRPDAVIDAQWPMGRRLAREFGDAFVSIRSFGVADVAKDPTLRAAAERDAFLHLSHDAALLAPEDGEKAFDYTTL